MFGKLWSGFFLFDRRVIKLVVPCRPISIFRIQVSVNLGGADFVFERRQVGHELVKLAFALFRLAPFLAAFRDDAILLHRVNIGAAMRGRLPLDALFFKRAAVDANIKAVFLKIPVCRALPGFAPLFELLLAIPFADFFAEAYLRLASPQLALRRIAGRVRQGGHNVQKADVLRRFSRSLSNFHRIPTLRTQRKLSCIINRSLNDTAGTISGVILRKRTAVGRSENPRVRWFDSAPGHQQAFERWQPASSTTL